MGAACGLAGLRACLREEAWAACLLAGCSLAGWTPHPEGEGPFWAIENLWCQNYQGGSPQGGCPIGGSTVTVGLRRPFLRSPGMRQQPSIGSIRGGADIDIGVASLPMGGGGCPSEVSAPRRGSSQRGARGTNNEGGTGEGIYGPEAGPGSAALSRGFTA